MDASISIVCQSPCLWLGEHLDYCKKPNVIEGTSDLWTWVPENASWIYLIKIMGFTLAYVPENDTVFFVNPAYSIKNSCPSNIVFAAQCCRDPNCLPRLLVVDILCDCGKSTGPMEPVARYRRLQELQDHFVEPNCVVQWCGEKHSLTDEFLASLPHRTRARLGIGRVPGEFIVE